MELLGKVNHSSNKGGLDSSSEGGYESAASWCNSVLERLGESLESPSVGEAVSIPAGSLRALLSMQTF